ncbi:MAG: TonB-dependent receptor [Chitinophagales bacterium]
MNFNHTTSVEQAYVLLKRQDKYGQGLINPDGSNSLDSGENFSWGPEFDGVVRPWTSPVDADGDGTLEYLSRPYSAVEDQLTNFFRLGRTNVNSVSISGGNDLLTYRVSYGNTYQRGILENTDYNRHNFGVGASAKLSDRLSSNFNVSYSTINQNTAQEGSRAFEGQNPYASAIQGPVNIPYNEVRDYNNPFHGFDGYYGSYTVNPYFVLNEYRNEGNINNFLANMFINYELFKGVNLNTRIGTNLVGTVIEEVTPIYAYSDHYYWGDNLTLISRSDRQSSAGAYERFNKNSKTIDWTTKVDFERFVDKDERLNLGISLGFNYWDLNIRRDQLRTQGGLSVPGVYNLANSVNPSLATQNDLRRRMVGLLGHVSLGLDNTFFLEYSARNDRSSTLPKENMDFFYHAIGASAVLTESLNLDDNILNYLKVRGSWGTSGKDADPYLLESVYFSNPVAIEYNDIYSIQFPLDGQPATTTGRAIGNPNLKPELTQTFEIGADVGFFDDRIVLEYTYYNSNHKDQIVNVSLASTSGFGQTAQNVGRITNKGHELGLFLKPIYRRNGFKWNVDLTFSKNKNEVVKISDDLDELVIWSSGRGVTLVAEEGQPFGVFKGQAPKYDPNGNPIVNSNGTLAYTEETVALGSVQPDWIAGLGTSFGYKNLSLGFLFDFKKGNEIFSLTKSATEFNGTAITTLLEDRKPFVLANSVQEILDEESGEVVGYEANTKATLADAFLFDGNYSRNVLDGSFAKLREITLTYDLPARTVAKMKVEGISVGLFAKNVKFWLPEENSFGDPEVNGPQESQTNVQGIETTQTPPSRSFGINLNINF